ncbi:MAG TPA: HAD family hydrolase [Steroidobacteraceae bacterium]|nr:HAD family hydrolase [Steroidobacteraceae bacterium]
MTTVTSSLGRAASRTAVLRDIRAVAFDLDDTLWDVGPVIHRAERCLHAWLREHCPRITERLSMEEMRAARERLALSEPHNAHDFTYLRITALAAHARECGYAEEVAERAFEIFFAARNELRPFPDVQPALERLRGRYTLASLSNGNADLGLIGLAPLFSLSLNARQIGAAKPHPLCFQRLADGLRLEPRNILYVGDDPMLDIEAARAAGLRTAWMNRGREPWPGSVETADFDVADCMHLAQLLALHAPSCQT